MATSRLIRKNTEQSDEQQQYRDHCLAASSEASQWKAVHKAPRPLRVLTPETAPQAGRRSVRYSRHPLPRVFRVASRVNTVREPRPRGTVRANGPEEKNVPTWYQVTEEEESRYRQIGPVSRKSPDTVSPSMERFSIISGSITTSIRTPSTSSKAHSKKAPSSSFRR